VPNELNCYTLVADCPIWLKFCTATHTNVPEKTALIILRAGSRIQPLRGVIPFWGHIVAADQDNFTTVGVCEDNGVTHLDPFSRRKSKMADGGQVQ